jgi:hypothetical protein
MTDTAAHDAPPADQNARQQHPRAITMWDFSWLERRWSGGGYEDWDRALDELVDRGYDAVRIDAYPHLIAAGAERSWELVPVWTEHAWGSPLRTHVQVQPQLNEFIAKCRDRNVAVGLSSWFREDTEDTRMRLDSAPALADAWIETLRSIEADGLLDAILYVDLANEFPLRPFAPFVFPKSSKAFVLSRTTQRVASFMRESIALVRGAYPNLPLCYSFVFDIRAGAREEDVEYMDVLELHLWLALAEASSFYAAIGYDVMNSGFDPSSYEVLADAPRVYAEDPDRWLGGLYELIEASARWSERSGKPLMTTEAWGPINYKDGPGLDWDWVLHSCEAGVRAALATERWAAVCTSNFCGPQFVGMWREVEWHRRLTDAIRSSRLAVPLSVSR